MKLHDAQKEFAQIWGSFGTSWGIPKSMAQIHALLLVNKEPLTAEDVMETIQISRGNVNTNMRELISWKLVKKQNKLGERKEFFIADQDLWSMSQNIIKERNRRELEPVGELLDHLLDEKIQGDKEGVDHFKRIIKEMKEFIVKMGEIAEIAGSMKQNFFFNQFIKMLK